MPTPFGRDEISALDELETWMGDEERRLRVCLGEVDLVVRADLDEAEVQRIQGFYGIAAQRHRRKGRAIRHFIDRYPALTMTALVGHAALAYEHGRYWESFWAELGLPRTLAFENALRECVESNLQRFGLDAFPSLRGQYVQTLGVHAGVPIHCMGALVEVADEYLHRGRLASGAGLMDWIVRSDKNPQVLKLAKPVRNFLMHGGSFAIEVLDYLVKNVDRMLDGGTPNAIELDIRTIPRILRQGFDAALEVHAFGRSGGAGASSAARGRRSPSVVFTPLDDQVVIELPPTELGEEEKWRVWYDGDIAVASPSGEWGLDWREWEPTRLPIPKPARELVIECSSAEAAWRVPLVRTNDPILLFDRDGRWLRNQAVLPKGQILAVYPEHARLVDEVADVDLQPYAVFGSPGGWRGWQVAAVDLSPATSLRVVTDARKGILRGVRVIEVPRLELGAPIVGLTTAAGVPVYAVKPRLRLPGRGNGEDSSWRVQVRRSIDRGPVTDSTYTTGVDARTVEPFAGVHGDLAGQFDIAVTGSAGSSLRYTVFVLEGVDVTIDRWVRPPALGGLEPVTAQIPTRSSIRPVETSVEFSGSDIKRNIRFTAAVVTHALVLTPPYVRIHVGSVGHAIRWRTSVPMLFHADLDEQSLLVLSVPGCSALRLELVGRDSTALKWYCPRRTGDGHFEADLRVFTDVARRAGDCVLTAVAVSEDQKIVRFTAAQIRPVGSCREIRIEDESMVFDGLRVVDNLVANVWWSTAPWAGAREIPVTDVVVPLPKDLIAAGKLLVQLRVSDPWVLDEPPQWPDNRVFEIDQAGYRRDRNKNRERLSKYLAQGGGHPPRSPQVMPEIWTVLARTLHDPGDVLQGQMRRELLRVVSENPRTALESLGNSTIPTSRLPSLVVHTELARQNYGSTETSNELHSNPWVGCMIEISDLPPLSARRRTARGERLDTLNYLEQHGGDPLITVLGCGTLPSTGRPEHEIVSDLVSLGDDALDYLATEIRSVPGPMLSPEARWSAYLEAFDQRSIWTGPDSPLGLIVEARHLSADLEERSPALYSAVSERLAVFAEIGADAAWTAVPAFSLVAAGLARLEAHQFERELLTPAVLEHWGRVAVHCPTLVATDLVFAEAVLTFEEYGDLVTDSPSKWDDRF
ncbi:hypothetical protein TVH25_00270 [Rhodococcus sp. 7Tela_A2]|uniref:hypothetical protein n=1 Tax=Rhodococcus sp. 7Tela_A2 TaxID=3093744 RepID=UPI003BB50199